MLPTLITKIVQQQWLRSMEHLLCARHMPGTCIITTSPAGEGYWLHIPDADPSNQKVQWPRVILWVRGRVTVKQGFSGASSRPWLFCHSAALSLRHGFCQKHISTLSSVEKSSGCGGEDKDGQECNYLPLSFWPPQPSSLPKWTILPWGAGERASGYCEPGSSRTQCNLRIYSEGQFLGLYYH